MSKFTKGPWRIERDNTVLIEMSKFHFVEAYAGTAANARLIAAAPVMFDALEKIARQDPEGYFGEIARAALSTATRSTNE